MVIFIVLCQISYNRRCESVALFSAQVTATGQWEHTGFIWCLVNRPFPQPALLRLLLTRLQLSWTVCSLKSFSKTPGKVNGDRQLVQMASWAFVWDGRVSGKHRGWKPREVRATCVMIMWRFASAPSCDIFGPRGCDTHLQIIVYPCRCTPINTHMVNYRYGRKTKPKESNPPHVSLWKMWFLAVLFKASC